MTSPINKPISPFLPSLYSLTFSGMEANTSSTIGMMLSVLLSWIKFITSAISKGGLSGVFISSGYTFLEAVEKFTLPSSTIFLSSAICLGVVGNWLICYVYSFRYDFIGPIIQLEAAL